jgi:hypothetical protein
VSDSSAASRPDPQRYFRFQGLRFEATPGADARATFSLTGFDAQPTLLDTAALGLG